MYVKMITHFRIDMMSGKEKGIQMEAKLKLQGRIDSANAEETGRILMEGIEGADSAVIDCSELEYISSAGLRAILRLRKSLPGGITMTNVSREVYEIFDMTGFVQMMNIQRAYRVLSVEGCEVIGEGANGIVYRIDPDTVVKVYKNTEDIDTIHRERELSRNAFLLGVPTAIPYDVVMIDDGVHYGAVFEMLNAESYASLLIDGEKTIDEIAEMTAETLHSVHDAVPEEGFLPDKREEYLGKIDDFRDCIPADQTEKLLSMLKAMPHDPHMIHGDFHIKNIMVQNGESLIIDMDTLAVGDPVFEFAAMYAAYLGFSEADPDNVMEFFGISKETVTELWKSTLRAYFGNEADAEAADKKIRLTAAVFLLSFMIRHTEREENFRSRLIEMNIKNIDRLIGEVDGLAIRKD